MRFVRSRCGFNENESNFKWDTNRGYLGGIIQARNRRKLVGNAAPCMPIYSDLGKKALRLMDGVLTKTKLMAMVVVVMLVVMVLVVKVVVVRSSHSII
ncbi:hypothetical protein M0804_011552 [Polistes exclamans]|nr:hypothetical protein M0804_011552 [Polistes exclamans]